MDRDEVMLLPATAVAHRKTDSSRLGDLALREHGVGPASPSCDALQIDLGQNARGVDRTKGLVLTKNFYGVKLCSTPNFKARARADFGAGPTRSFGSLGASFGLQTHRGVSGV